VLRRSPSSPFTSPAASAERTRMKYLLLIHLDETQFASRPTAEQDHMYAESNTWHDDLAARGISLGCSRLDPAGAVTLRESDGDVLVTHGPFVEMTEVLGGYELVECADRDEAIAVARTFPGLRLGFAVEIRQVDSRY
jgi:hypothetical protein